MELVQRPLYEQKLVYFNVKKILFCSRKFLKLPKATKQFFSVLQKWFDSVLLLPTLVWTNAFEFSLDPLAKDILLIFFRHHLRKKHFIESHFSFRLLFKRGKNEKKDVSMQFALSSKGEIINVDKCIEMTNTYDAFDEFYELQIEAGSSTGSLIQVKKRRVSPIVVSCSEFEGLRQEILNSIIP